MLSSISSAAEKLFLSSAEGVIVVKAQKAMININGINYIILRENPAYVQFEGRYIKMYQIIIDRDNCCIEFKGFRFIDAYV
jgi:hypothetical protein